MESATVEVCAVFCTAASVVTARSDFMASANLLTASFAALSAACLASFWAALALSRWTTWDSLALSSASSSLVLPTLTFCWRGFKETGSVMVVCISGADSGSGGRMLTAGFFTSGSIFGTAVSYNFV